MVRFAIILTLALAAYWLTLSGYFTKMLLTLGVISILTVLGLCYRMKIFDDETVPYLHTIPSLAYFVWLFAEIAKANMEVVRAVLKPDMEISPTMLKVPAPQKTDLGRTMFANSITLTPGTVSVAMEGDDIIVHALLESMSAPEGFAEMGERSARSVGEKGAS